MMFSGLTLGYLCTYQYIIPEVISKHRVHQYVSGLTSIPKAELFCSCKRRKFIGQNKIRICKL